MIVTLHRPSPQVPRPSTQSAIKCYDSAAFVIDISSKQMMSAAVDITWVFLLTLYMSLNTLLWCVASYADVRAAHSREEVQELVNVALDIIDQCVERWPGTASASELYSILTKACLQSYDSSGTPHLSSPGSLNTPPSQPETSSPNSMELSSGMALPQPGASAFNPPQFGLVFGSAPESMNSYTIDSSLPQHPTFRSNSIFLNPATNDHTGRRFSYFPPDFTQAEAVSGVDLSPPPSESTISPPFLSSPQLTQTPPENISMQATTPVMSTINTPMISTPLIPSSVSQTSPEAMIANGLPQTQPRPPLPAFTIPSLPPGQLPHGQRPLPQATTVTDWFNPPPPFISPYSFGTMGAGSWGNASGINGFDGIQGNNFDLSRLPPERQGSLSQAQQIELMGVLENEGMADIDSYLNTTNLGYGDTSMGNADMGMTWGTQS